MASSKKIIKREEVVDKKKAITIPPIRIVLSLSTALVENHTKRPKTKQKSKDPMLLEICISPCRLLMAFSVILPPEVI